MAKTRLNTEDAFRSIMGKAPDKLNQDAGYQPVETEVDTEVETGNMPPLEPEAPAAAPQAKEKLLQTAFYITKKQRAALKVRTALGERPEDKDQSSIVRAALDAYLADTLKTLQ